MVDHMYGIYLHKNELIFSKRFDVDDANNIIIDDVRYADLYELIQKNSCRCSLHEKRYARTCYWWRTRTNTSIIRRVDYWATRDTSIITPLMSVSPRNRRRNVERDYFMQWHWMRSITCTGMIPTNWWIVYDCSTLRTEQQRSRQRDVVDHRETSKLILL